MRVGKLRAIPMLSTGRNISFEAVENEGGFDVMLPYPHEANTAAYASSREVSYIAHTRHEVNVESTYRFGCVCVFLSDELMATGTFFIA